MLSIIVAKAKNNVIGKDNKLIWHLPEDLKRFKAITSGHTIIMGRKTFESLGRVLPNRHHIIISKENKLDIDNENVEIINDISLIDKYINDEKEHFVIGGASIYKLLMPYCKKMYITEINMEFDGDVFFHKSPQSNGKYTIII
ncbi:MAG: dihydrofolate reductase, partial [Clostridia bacterium]|nr:dihydrofolate reductase [Clostridia bacterium]